MSKLYTARDFLKTEKIISFSPDDTLSKALSSLWSSHDAAFVLTDKGLLLGAVNPYNASIHGRFPPETKLKRCMLMPPKITLSTPLFTIVRDMLESKIYFLPVADEKGKLLGIVSFRRILKFLTRDNRLWPLIQNNIMSRKVFTVTKDISLAQARALLKSKQTSRLPVVNNQGRLIGLLTRFDLRQAYSDPSDAQRNPRLGQKKKALSYPIEGFYKTQVITELNTAPVADMVETMRVSKVGSVVLVDGDDKPVGMAAYRDIMKAILRSLPGGSIHFQVKIPTGFTDQKTFEESLLITLQRHFKGEALLGVEGRLSRGKDVDDSAKWYELSLYVSTGRATYAGKQRADGWRKVLTATVAKLAAQK